MYVNTSIDWNDDGVQTLCNGLTPSSSCTVTGCHRVLLARSVLGLEEAITVDVLFPNRSSDEDARRHNLWMFAPDGVRTRNGRFTQYPECTLDTVNGKTFVKEVYEMSGLDDQTSVPLLFDKKTRTVVNNESAEIMRMMATEMKPFSSRQSENWIDLYPTNKSNEIDDINEWVYKDINNGSYKAGFSSNQDVYETAYKNYFSAMKRLDDMLADKQFLTGDSVTEADLRLFPSLFRHDSIYYNRFKLNLAYLWEYSNLWRWMGDVMKLEGMEPVSNAAYLSHCKQGYFGRTDNGTIPLGPPNYPECYMIPDYKPSCGPGNNHGGKTESAN
jgi:glutathionyl-hydroquinone reductase